MGCCEVFGVFAAICKPEKWLSRSPYIAKNDVNIVKSLPEYFKSARRRNEFHTFKPKNSASPNFYVKEILPSLKKAKVVALVNMDGGCLQLLVPASKSSLDSNLLQNLLPNLFSDVAFCKRLLSVSSFHCGHTSSISIP
ncbi:hypothetical protein V6N13_020097 [Hibiscus sabdariffa]